MCSELKKKNQFAQKRGSRWTVFMIFPGTDDTYFGLIAEYIFLFLHCRPPYLNRILVPWNPWAKNMYALKTTRKISATLTIVQNFLCIRPLENNSSKNIYKMSHVVILGPSCSDTECLSCPVSQHLNTDIGFVAHVTSSAAS